MAKFKGIAFWLGVAVVILSHIWMLYTGEVNEGVYLHGIENIVAAALIIYGKI